MSEKYKIIKSRSHPKFSIYDDNDYCIAQLGSRISAVTICDALNRLEALEKACLEIEEVTQIDTKKPEFTTAYSDGYMDGESSICRKVSEKLKKCWKALKEVTDEN